MVVNSYLKFDHEIPNFVSKTRFSNNSANLNNINIMLFY
jgi:hypothetical protein